MLWNPDMLSCMPDAPIPMQPCKPAKCQGTACEQWWLPDAPDIAARAISVKSAAEMLQHLQRMSREEVTRRLRQVLVPASCTSAAGSVMRQILWPPEALRVHAACTLCAEMPLPQPCCVLHELQTSYI